MNVFTRAGANEEPYQAILPNPAIVGEVNSADAYRAGDSERLFSRFEEDSDSDFELNEILWRSIKGRKAPLPDTPGTIWRARDY
jgi:hypothetical protein